MSATHTLCRHQKSACSEGVLTETVVQNSINYKFSCKYEWSKVLTEVIFRKSSNGVTENDQKSKDTEGGYRKGGDSIEGKSQIIVTIFSGKL